MSRMDKMFKIDRRRGLLACEAFLILLNLVNREQDYRINTINRIRGFLNCNVFLLILLILLIL